MPVYDYICKDCQKPSFLGDIIHRSIWTLTDGKEGLAIMGGRERTHLCRSSQLITLGCHRIACLSITTGA
jgi:hypothetical protein